MIDNRQILSVGRSVISMFHNHILTYTMLIFQVLKPKCSTRTRWHTCNHGMEHKQSGFLYSTRHIRQGFYASSPFYVQNLTLIPAWIINHTNYDVWDKIAYPFPNFNGVTVWVWKFNFIPRFPVVNYPCRDQSWSVLVIGAPGIAILFGALLPDPWDIIKCHQCISVLWRFTYWSMLSTQSSWGLI